MKLVHELWVSDDSEEFTFCLAGPGGESARATLKKNARLTWTCNAESYFEAMTKYYEHQGWGEYTSDFVQDRLRYIDEFGRTNTPNAE